MVSTVSAHEREDHGLSNRILDDLQAVFSRYPEVRQVLLYGSRARGDHHPGSDIDLAVDAPGMASERFAALWGGVDELPVAFRIDPLHLQSLTDSRLLEQIRREGKPPYRKAEAV